MKDRKRQRANRKAKHHEEKSDKRSDYGYKAPGFPVIRIGTRILIPIEAFREWLVITSNKQE